MSGIGAMISEAGYKYNMEALEHTFVPRPPSSERTQADRFRLGRADLGEQIEAARKI